MVMVFSSFEIANTLLLEIAATPNDLVWVWYNPTDPGWDEVIVDEFGNFTTVHHDAKGMIAYNNEADGRIAIEHPWSQDDIDWLQEYLDGESVTFYDNLPEDWQEAGSI